MGFWFIAWIVVTVIMFALRTALQPKMQKRGPGELQAPICEQGHPIAYVAGCAKIRGGNVVWKGKTEPRGKEKDQLWDYYCRMQIALCHGVVDRIRRVWFNQDTAPEIATVKYTRGASSPIHNAANVSSASVHSSPPYPEGDTGSAENLGAVAIVGASPSGWKSKPPAGYFAVYSRVRDAWNTRWIYVWRTLTPALGDTINIAGVYSRWDGAAWSPAGSDPLAVGAKQAIALKIDSKEKSLKIRGEMWWYDGSADQAPDPTLVKLQRNNGVTPGYSGLCYVVLTDWTPTSIGFWNQQSGLGFYWGESPSIPEISFEVERIPNPLGLPASPISTGVANVLNVKSVRSYNTPPYIGGNSGPGGGASPHGEGTVIVVGNSPADLTYWGSSAAGKQGWFAKYVNTAGVTYLWQFTQPNVDDSVVLDGTYAVWNGQGWIRGDSDWAPCIDGGAEGARDANPANVLYELLTDPVLGLGVGAADVDVASFRDAGRILYREGIGITLVLDQQMAFDDAAKEINMVADGVLFEDPSTGLWTYRLVREPIDAATASTWGLETTFYTRTDWPVFDEDDFSGEPEYTRGSWGDVANQIKVQYMDRSEGYAQRVVDVQDLGNYLSQGELVTIQNTYNAVTKRATAIRLAYRDLRTTGVPRARLKDRLNRRGWSLRPADCFVVNRPELGISNMRFRVTNIRYGTMQDMGVEVEAIEDVFGMPDTVYQEPGTGWVDPGNVLPIPPSAVRAWELAYDVTRDGPRVGFAALVARADEDTTGAILWRMVGGTLQEVGPISYTPTGVLTGALAIEERTSTIQLQGLMDFQELQAIGAVDAGENLLLVDDELIGFSAIGWNADGTAYLSGCWRGVLDTIPRTHEIGARAWIIRRPPPVSPEISTADREEVFGIQATASGGKTETLGMPMVGGTTDSRELRPFVPGKFRVESSDLATAMQDRVLCGDVDVSWEKRNRLTQAPGVVAQDADSVDPEPGQNSRMVSRHGAWQAFTFRLEDGTEWEYGQEVEFPILGGRVEANFSIEARGKWYGAVGLVDGPSYPFDDLNPYPGGPGVAWTSARPVPLPPSDLEFVSVPVDGSGVFAFANHASTTLFNVARITVRIDGSKGYATLHHDAAEVERVNSPSATTHTVTVTDIVATEAVGPMRVEVDAVRDGLGSLEQRESGLVFPAGYGMSYGLHYGGA